MKKPSYKHTEEAGAFSSFLPQNRPALRSMQRIVLFAGFLACGHLGWAVSGGTGAGNAGDVTLQDPVNGDVATGSGSTASGGYSMAIGIASQATGLSSTAMGGASSASGVGSMALGT